METQKLSFRRLTRLAFAALSAIFVLSSCSKEVYVDGSEDSGGSSSGDGNSMLMVQTRAVDTDLAGSGEAKVSYPVNIYVFDSNGTCCALSTIEDENTTSAVIALDEGTYEVCAVAGASADAYTLPTQATATKSSVVEVKKAHSDLMTASNTVTVSKGGSNTLTLSLVRKVMLVENITMTNMPENLQSVSVTMSPLYANITIGGSYTGTTNGVIELSQVEGTRTWTTQGGVYLLESSATEATVAVNMTAADGTVTSYTYDSTNELIANSVISIEASYVEDGTVELTGQLVGATWGDTRQITFSFTDDDLVAGATTPSTGEQGGSTTTTGTVPEPYTLYMDKYFVLNVTATSAGTEVLLLSPIQRQGFLTSSDTPLTGAEWQDLINTMMADYSDVAGWRLFSEDEINYINDNIDAINNSPNIGTMVYGPEYDYMFSAADGTIKSYNFSNKETRTTQNRYSTLRPVATILFN